MQDCDGGLENRRSRDHGASRGQSPTRPARTVGYCLWKSAWCWPGSTIQRLPGFPVGLPGTALLGARFDHNVKILTEFLSILGIVFEDCAEQLTCNVRSL